jgi:hypothetical protein
MILNSKAHWILSPGTKLAAIPAVNVMITILGEFRQFLFRKMEFFLKFVSKLPLLPFLAKKN